MIGEPVVITGVGVWSAAGRGPTWLDRCYAEPDEDAAALGVPTVCRVHGAPADPEFPDDRKAWLAFAAAADAVQGAGGALLRGPDGAVASRPPEPPGGSGASDGPRRGVWLGTGLSSVTPDELERDILPFLVEGRLDRPRLAHALERDHPAPRRHLPERVTRVLAERWGARTAETSFSACAAAAQSILAAARAVARGDVDQALCGGHDSMLHPVGLLSFVVLGALSPTTGRPFDRHRDGFLIGEGAAMLLLERERDARARGAPVLGRILGGGTSVDAHNVTAPHPEGHGAGLAMRRALRDAGLAPGDIDYVNTHGTGTPVGDRAEALAVSGLLGDVPVSSFKGAVGHTIAAAGAVELAHCLEAFRLGRTPRSVGLEELDPACPANVLHEDLARRPAVILSNSFGFGGQNCALILGAP